MEEDFEEVGYSIDLDAMKREELQDLCFDLLIENAALIKENQELCTMIDNNITWKDVETVH